MVRPEVGASVQHRDLEGATALVTGATGGVGREVALALGRLGADVHVHGRNADRGERVASDLRGLGADASFFLAEYTDLDQVETLAERVRDRVDELDVLVNNAGAHFDEGRLTDLGVERTFHANHLAPFLLTNRLRDVLASGGRIVTVSSEVHRRASLDFEELTAVDAYEGLDAYARSKLANVLFARELARRTDDLTSVSCHPGFVPATGIWRNAPLPVRAVMLVLSAVPRSLTFGRVDTPSSAAVTPTFLAATDREDGENGAYFRDCAPVEPSPEASDDALAERLWEWSAQRVSL
ncbi:SDR family NAD(P)-dependent oxidoreductase [Halobacterium wangiae]|uniref:SDR family NAD(P)-dependent oxidoreductase n=1 Tax=Halobacterium wangiae TaxID=2902623 RepID=UPI001E285A73|nr:SDR family NAD(P)-dependent oxidoreductase [Halobacterium wangiae]